MAYQHKENRGSLFRNERKSEDKQPDHKGECNIGGDMYWVSAWIDQTNEGKKYFSLSFQLKDEERKAIKEEPAPVSEDFDDDVPF